MFRVVGAFLSFALIAAIPIAAVALLYKGDQARDEVRYVWCPAMVDKGEMEVPKTITFFCMPA